MASFLSSYLHDTPLVAEEAAVQADASGCCGGWAWAAAGRPEAPSEPSDASSASDSDSPASIPASPEEGGKRRTQYNQSQWTQEEHKRFVEALARYQQLGSRRDPVTGKVSVGLGAGVAKQVAAFVGTRTPLQVRTHAQKYFMKLSTGSKRGGRMQ